MLSAMGSGDGRTFLFHIFRLGSEVESLLAEALADAPLTPSEYAIYSAIFEAEPVTPREIGRELGMPPQTVSDWMAVLRRREHLRSGPNPRDKRSVLVWLSANGRRVHRETSVLFESAFQAVAAELPDGEEAARREVVKLSEAVRRARVSRTQTATQFSTQPIAQSSEPVPSRSSNTSRPAK